MRFKNNLDVDKGNIKILDHSCDSALTLWFWILKGYKNVWGVTVNFENDPEVKKNIIKINELIRLILNSNYYEDRVKIYDGNLLPFKK